MTTPEGRLALVPREEPEGSSGGGSEGGLLTLTRVREVETLDRERERDRVGPTAGD